MNNTIHRLKYLIADAVGAGAAWTFFYIYRKTAIESVKFAADIPLTFDERYFVGLALIPIFWLSLYYFAGYYKNIYRKSRLQELGQTLFVSLVGVLLIFFGLILDDTIVSYKSYYHSFLFLFGAHFLATYLPRVIITSRTIHRLRKRKIGFNTIIVGSNQKAIDLYLSLNSQKHSLGYNFLGFVSVNGNTNYPLLQYLPHLGSLSHAVQVVSEYRVEEAIVAIESSEHEDINRIINKLEQTNVIIKVIPGIHEIIRGMANMNHLYGVPLIEIKHDLMPAWEENLKRIIDIAASLVALVILLPVYVFLAVGVKLSSSGPVFYSHERIGRYGKPFIIYKFRSMYTDAEKNGPALSSENDKRITPFGLFMRKSRLDELPQFYNVLIGDMSLVGPRPERQFFIDQIVEKAPYYYHLQKVKPGLSSWGQVKFGYAGNVDEMVERLKYDIIYLENMSVYADLKILVYTILIVIKGKGK